MKSLPNQACVCEQIFLYRPDLCDRVEIGHVKRLVRLIIRWHQRAPGLLEVPRVLVQGDGPCLHARSQYMLMKHMLDVCYQDKCRISFMAPQERSVIGGTVHITQVSWVIKLRLMFSLKSFSVGRVTSQNLNIFVHSI